MTEQEWLNCEDPWQMLTHSPSKISDSKVKLWATAVRDLAFPEDKGTSINLSVSQIVETWGWLWRKDGGYERGKKNCPLSTRVNLLREVIGNPFKPIKFLAGDPIKCPRCQGRQGRWGRYDGFDATWRDCSKCQGAGIVDSPSPILTWRDGLIPKTAQDIYDSEKWEELGILADMCEDACCDNQDLLMHLRGKERCPKCLGAKYILDGEKAKELVLSQKGGIATESALQAIRAGIVCQKPCLCQTGSIPLRGPHVKGCHVLDALTGRE